MLVSITVPETLLKGLRKSCHILTLVTCQHSGSENVKRTEICVSAGRKCPTGREKRNSEGKMLKNSGSGAVAEGPEAAVICLSWKLHSSRFHQKPDITLFYPISAKFNRDTEQLGKASADPSACEESQLKWLLMWLLSVLWGVSVFLSHKSGMLSFLSHRTFQWFYLPYFNFYAEHCFW